MFLNLSKLACQACSCIDIEAKRIISPSLAWTRTGLKHQRPNAGRVTVSGVGEMLRNGQHSRPSSFFNLSTTPLALARPTHDGFIPVHGPRKKGISTFPPPPRPPPTLKGSNSLRCHVLGRQNFLICLAEPSLSDVHTSQNKAKTSVAELLQSPVYPCRVQTWVRLIFSIRFNQSQKVLILSQLMTHNGFKN